MMVSLGVKDDAYISIPRRQLKNIKKDIVIDSNLTAPINNGQAVGYVSIKLDGKPVTTIKLHAMNDVEEGSLYRRTIDSILKNF